MNRNILWVAVALIVLSAGLILLRGFSHTEQRWNLTDISGHLPDLRFSLVDDTGQAVTDERYRGEVALLYFGFTACSSQCPAALARLANLLGQLGQDAQKVRVLFVSVNPANDTPPVLHRYLAQFDPQYMTGLTGNRENIRTLAKRLRAAYAPDYHGPGDIPHSNIIYIFDRAGHARLLVTPEDTDAAILHDVRQLLHD